MKRESKFVKQVRNYIKTDLVLRLEREFEEGKYRDDTKDLPHEIQFRLGCKWGEALSIANKIRIRGNFEINPLKVD
jgi:hypothetical protein